MQLRVSKAHAESEANFQRDRHAAAEALIASCRKDILDERASKSEIQALLSSVQRCVSRCRVSPLHSMSCLFVELSPASLPLIAAPHCALSSPPWCVVHVCPSPPPSPKLLLQLSRGP